MGTNNKHKINNQNLEEWFRSTGFLFPTNEFDLARFEGKICSCGTKVLHIKKSDELKSEIEGLRMVARKGQEVPKHILDKMTKKHRKNNDSEEE